LPTEQQVSSWTKLLEVLIQAAEKHGVIAIFVFLVFVLMAGLIVYLMRATIKTKDEEIERLVAERNKLQDIILEERKSSKQPPAKK
jgi:hypothetical protein